MPRPSTGSSSCSSRRPAAATMRSCGSTSTTRAASRSSTSPWRTSGSRNSSIHFPNTRTGTRSRSPHRGSNDRSSSSRTTCVSRAPMRGSLSRTRSATTSTSRARSVRSSAMRSCSTSKAAERSGSRTGTSREHDCMSSSTSARKGRLTMASELMEALKALAREKNIDEYAMLDRLESSLAATYRKILDLENETRVVLDHDSGGITVFELVPVGGTEEEPVFEERDVTPPDVSRTAAQAAKSVIIGMIRDAERAQVFDEYQGRVGDAVTGTVQQSDARYTLIKLREGVEALLPPSEQPSNERYDHNQRLKAYIIEVRKTTKEPSIVVSRTHPGLLKRLFELEVPEIYDGIVEIKSVAREPGMRSKVAVSSREPGLDPVGACVGLKGSRVRMVVAELRGERIDVVPWNEDAATTMRT